MSNREILVAYYAVMSNAFAEAVIESERRRSRQPRRGGHGDEGTSSSEDPLVGASRRQTKYSRGQRYHPVAGPSYTERSDIESTEEELSQFRTARKISETGVTSPFSTFSFGTYEEGEVMTSSNEEVVTVPQELGSNMSRSEIQMLDPLTQDTSTPTSTVVGRRKAPMQNISNLERDFIANTSRVLAAIRTAPAPVKAAPKQYDGTVEFIRQSLLETPQENKEVLEQTLIVNCLKYKHMRRSSI